MKMIIKVTNIDIRMCLEASSTFLWDGLFRDINSLHDNEVNEIHEFNLLHGILNLSKLTKYINSHYYPILDGCMSTRRGRAKT